MLAKTPRLFITIAALCVICIACVSMTAAGTAIWCDALSRPPEAVVYPGARLLSETSAPGVYSLADRHYTSPDSPDKITDFYQGKMFQEGYQPGTSCPDSNLGGECFGNATPAGKYYVYIDPTLFLKTSTTTFTIEFRWKACGWDI